MAYLKNINIFSVFVLFLIFVELSLALTHRFLAPPLDDRQVYYSKWWIITNKKLRPFPEEMKIILTIKS